MSRDVPTTLPKSGLSTPAILQVEITSHCNLRCRLCPLSLGTTLSGHDPGGMTPVTEAAFLDLAVRTGQVIFAGFGEPLLSKRFLVLLEQLDRLGVVCSMSTNGIPLTIENSRRLAALPNLVHINVSIDSPDPEIYQSMRGADLSGTLKGLSNLLSAIDDPARVSVSSVASHENAASLRRFPPLLKALGVFTYVVQRDAEFRYSESLCSDQDEFAANIEKLQAACAATGVKLTLHGYRPMIKGDWAVRALHQLSDDTAIDLAQAKQCMLPWELPYIDKDGRVFPCCVAAEQPDAVLGNLSTQDFDSIWRGAAYSDFRTAMQRGSTLPKLCRGCAVVPSGLHPLQAFSAELMLSEGDFDDPARITVHARNTGRAAWTTDRPVRLATSRSRDGLSVFHDPSWITPNRVCTHLEEQVRPGEIATFSAPFTVPAHRAVGHFELVVDGVCWLPGTRIAIALPWAATTRAN